MNLHGIVSPLVSTINPSQTATLRVSTGYATSGDGTQVPAYAADQPVQAQVQELTQKDLRKLEGLNVQGSELAIYVSGQLRGAQRASSKGGDLVIIGTNYYLTTAVLEAWADWCKVAVTLQNGS